MKVFKRSLPTLIWILLMIIGIIFLSNSGASYGQYREEAWHIVRPIFMGSALFWVVTILMIIQTIILNMKSIKYHAVIESILLVGIICATVFLFKNFLDFTASYETVTKMTDPTEADLNILAHIFSYRKTVLLYTVLSIGAAAANVALDFIVKKRDIA